MHNPEGVPENETHMVFSDFEVQTDLLMSDRRPDQRKVKKKKKKTKKKKKKKKNKEKRKKESRPNCELCSPDRPQNKIKTKQKERLISRPC